MKKSPGHMAGELLKDIERKSNINLINMKLFQEIKEREHIPSHFMIPILPWYQYLEKIFQGKKTTDQYPLWKENEQRSQ